MKKMPPCVKAFLLSFLCVLPSVHAQQLSNEDAYCTKQQYGRSTLDWKSAFLNDRSTTAVDGSVLAMDVTVAVLFDESASDKDIEMLMRGSQFKANRPRGERKVAVGEISKTNILGLLNSPMVRYMEYMPPVVSLNYKSRMLHYINPRQAHPLDVMNLDGAGVVIGVGDGGDLGQHIDLHGRLTNIAQVNAWSEHQDHICGTLAGNGNLDPHYKGVAPQSTLITAKSFEIITGSEELYEAYEMVVTNNSYGPQFDCEEVGAYNLFSNFLDAQLYDNPKILHLFSAGNSGNEICGAYPQGYHTVLPYFQSAKNVLTIGNIRGDRKIAPNSSRGPVADGRLKPEVCGRGVGVWSMGEDFDYRSLSGTSASTPLVTATVALMCQRYRQMHDGQDPDGALMKAIVCNTADDLGKPGPDYIYGFGMVNGRRAIRSLENNDYLMDTIGQGQKQTFTLEVAPGTKELKVLLYWHDVEFNAFPMDSLSQKALVNDLDVRLITAQGQELLPWVLNPAPQHVNDLAIRAVDGTNNIEQVTLKAPLPGTYTIEVVGKSILTAAQKYFIAYELIGEELVLTHPVGHEKLVPGTEDLIVWDTEMDNASPFKVELSLDNGNSWALLQDNVPANRRYIDWTVSETMNESAFVRVSKIGSPFSDSSEHPFFILDTIADFRVLNDCSGSIYFEWAALAYAETYELMLLGDTEMESIGGTQNTKFVWQGSLEEGQRYWFSIRARTADFHTSQRSVAFPLVYSVPDPFESHIVQLSAASSQTAHDGSAQIELEGASENYRIIWDNGETSSLASQLSAGWHYVTIARTAMDHCSLTDSIFIELTTATEEELPMDAIKVTGMPSGQVRIEMSFHFPTGVRMSLYDVAGRCVLSWQKENLQHEILELSSTVLLPGIYYACFQIGQKRIVKEVVFMR